MTKQYSSDKEKLHLCDSLVVNRKVRIDPNTTSAIG